MRHQFFWVWIVGLLVGQGAGSAGFYNMGGLFSKNRTPHLVFTNAARTLATTWSCSGTSKKLTVQLKAGSSAAPVVSNTTVALSASAGFTYYSDSSCTTPITSATILAGNSSVDIFFAGFKNATFTVTATANSLTASQNEIITARITYTWIGGSSTNWSTGSNWQGGSVPGSGHPAYFDVSCTTHCSPALTAAVSVLGVNIDASYTGTISTSTYVLTIGTSGWSQGGGTFAGGTGVPSFGGPLVLSGGTFNQGANYSFGASVTISGGTYNQAAGNTISTNYAWTQSGGTFNGGSGVINFSGDYSLTGGIMTASSATTTVGANFTVSGTPTFSANGGTYAFVTTNSTITVGAETYNNVTYTIAGTVTLVGTQTIAGTLAGNQSGFCCNSFNGGTLKALGNVNLTGYGLVTNSSGGGTLTLLMAGSGTQTLTGASLSTSIPSLTITSTGTVNFVGSFQVFNNYVFNSGILNAGTSTVQFGNGGGSNMTVGTETYNNVTFNFGGPSTLTGTMKVAGTLTGNATVGCCVTFNGGTVVAMGDVNLTNYGIVANNGASGSAVVKVAGSGTQTITGVSGAALPNLTIASTGTVNLAGTIEVFAGYAFNSGTLNAGTSTVVLSGNALNISVGTETYNNVTTNFSGAATLTGTMQVAGTYTGNSTASCCVTVNGGTINALGNVTLTNFGVAPQDAGVGTLVVKMAGSGTQTLTGNGPTSAIPNLTIASTGTVNFANTIVVTNNYNFASGTLSAGSSTLKFIGITMSISTGGSEQYNNVNFSMSCCGIFTLTGTMNVAGTLTGSTGSFCCLTMNGGTINALGDITMTNYGFNGNSSSAGSTVIQVGGSGTQNLSGASGAGLPNLLMASSGTLNITGPNAVSGSVNATAGTLSLSSSSDSLMTNSMALGGRTFTKNGGTLTVGGMTVGAGALYGGTVAP